MCIFSDGEKMFYQQHGLALSTFKRWLKNYRQANNAVAPLATRLSQIFIPMVFNPILIRENKLLFE